MNLHSPYYNLNPNDWYNKTEQLLHGFPLTKEEIIEPILECWNDIFVSKIGKHNIQIGKDIFPSPQIMASYLHELIPLEFSLRYNGKWKKDTLVTDKDIIYIPDNKFSCELKTSSSKSNIYGNRSYAQESKNPKKDKSGYYIAVNFENFKESKSPKIRLIRFGWLDHTDWIGQKSETGQQATLIKTSEKVKLLTIFKKELK